MNECCSFSAVQWHVLMFPNHQAAAPCLTNMAAWCQFCPSRLQLSPKTRQTLPPCVWSLSQGKHSHQAVLFRWLSKWTCRYGGFDECTGEAVYLEGAVETNPDSKIEHLCLKLLKVLAGEFSSLICVATLPPSGQSNMASRLVSKSYRIIRTKWS